MISKLLNRNTTVEAIVAPLAGIVSKLETHIAAKEKAMGEKITKIDSLNAELRADHDEQRQAERAKAKIEALFA